MLLQVETNVLKFQYYVRVFSLRFRMCLKKCVFKKFPSCIKSTICHTEESYIVSITIGHNKIRYTRFSFFRTTLIRISVYPDSEFGRPTNEFKQRALGVLLEMPDRWLPTLVNTEFCWACFAVKAPQVFLQKKANNKPKQTKQKKVLLTVVRGE